jgi:hypothetical protein
MSIGKILLVAWLTSLAWLVVAFVYLAALLGFHEPHGKPTDAYWAIRELAFLCVFGFVILAAAGEILLVLRTFLRIRRTRT